MRTSKLILFAVTCALFVPASACAASTDAAGNVADPAKSPPKDQQKATASIQLSPAVRRNNLGVELGMSGQWPQAIEEHEAALTMNPCSKEFRTNLSSACLHYGNELFKQQKFDDAMHQFRFALFIDPANVPASERLDACYRALGNHPQDATYRKSVAAQLEARGQIEDAIAEYRALAAKADSAQSHADLGYILLRAERPVDAYLELVCAVKKSWPDSERTQLAQVHRTLAETLTKFAYKARDRGAGTVGMLRLHNAITEYRRAVTLNPDDGIASAGFIETTREAVALKPSFDNYLLLGGAYLLAHDFDHSKLCYEQCAKLEAGNADLKQARDSYDKMKAMPKSKLAQNQSTEKRTAESLSAQTKFTKLGFSNLPHTDVSLVVIACDEPIATLANFPPLPLQAEIPTKSAPRNPYTGDYLKDLHALGKAPVLDETAGSTELRQEQDVTIPSHGSKRFLMPPTPVGDFDPSLRDSAFPVPHVPAPPAHSD